VDRESIEMRVDELREAHPDRHDFVRAIKEYSETLEADDRELLGQVLLSKPTTGGFEELERRIEEGGWIRRTMRKVEPRERPKR
jgi:hypothetical protein